MSWPERRDSVPAMQSPLRTRLDAQSSSDSILIEFDEGPLEIRWGSVERSARGYLEALDTDPPRFRAAWPAARMLARLKAAARAEAREAGE